jgi:deoxyhypusine synthase
VCVSMLIKVFATLPRIVYTVKSTQKNAKSYITKRVEKPQNSLNNFAHNKKVRFFTPRCTCAMFGTKINSPNFRNVNKITIENVCAQINHKNAFKSTSRSSKRVDLLLFLYCLSKYAHTRGKSQNVYYV